MGYREAKASIDTSWRAIPDAVKPHVERVQALAQRMLYERGQHVMAMSRTLDTAQRQQLASRYNAQRSSDYAQAAQLITEAKAAMQAHTEARAALTPSQLAKEQRMGGAVGWTHALTPAFDVNALEALVRGTDE